MKNNEFDRFSDAWKKAEKVSKTQKSYTENDIKNFKMKNSKDFSRYIHKSIVFDYIHKGILMLGILLLAWFYRSDSIMLIALIVLFGLSAIFIYKEFNIQQKLKNVDDYTKELGEVIRQKLEFYKDNFTPLKLMLAFTNALLVWIGSMFYFYSKYGYYRVEDVGDIIVNAMMVFFSFIISYAALSWQLSNNAQELEEALDALDEEQSEILHKQLKRKRKAKMIMMVIASVGIFLFVVLLIIYLK